MSGTNPVTNNSATAANDSLSSNSCNGTTLDETVMISYRLDTMEILTALAILPFLAALVVGACEAEDEQI